MILFVVLCEHKCEFLKRSKSAFALWWIWKTRLQWTGLMYKDSSDKFKSPYMCVILGLSFNCQNKKWNLTNSYRNTNAILKRWILFQHITRTLTTKGISYLCTEPHWYFSQSCVTYRIKKGYNGAKQQHTIWVILLPWTPWSIQCCLLSAICDSLHILVGSKKVLMFDSQLFSLSL